MPFAVVKFTATVTVVGCDNLTVNVKFVVLFLLPSFPLTSLMLIVGTTGGGGGGGVHGLHGVNR